MVASYSSTSQSECYKSLLYIQALMNLENTIESPPLIRMGGRIDNTITWHIHEEKSGVIK